MSREKPCILVVDDEPSIRHLCQTILEHNGYRVMTAEDGVKAVDLYEKNNAAISLVLLDLSLPQLSGREVFAKIRELNSDAKIIICSAYIGASGNDLIDSGACAVIAKPFRPDELIKEIQSALNGEALAGQANS